MSGYAGDSWEPPVGHYIDVAGRTIPSDYLLCDGSAISRTTYAKLFAAIGGQYGAGDGSTTFNLPDYSAANRFSLPSAKRPLMACNYWTKDSSGKITINSSRTVTLSDAFAVTPNPAIKSDVFRRTGKYWFAIKPTMTAYAWSGINYINLGMTKSTSTTSATITADITTANNHYIKLCYTNAAMAVSFTSAVQFDNNTGRGISFAPAVADAIVMLVDFDARTWSIRSASSNADNLQVAGGSWEAGQDWYPFYIFESGNTWQIVIVDNASRAFYGISDAQVSGYRSWWDDNDVLTGIQSGTSTHTHTIQGTTLAAAQVPAVTASSTLLVATGSNNVVGALQTAANASSSHTHSIDTVSHMPPSLTHMRCIKYR